MVASLLGALSERRRLKMLASGRLSPNDRRCEELALRISVQGRWLGRESRAL
jgi:hypothetical protein